MPGTPRNLAEPGSHGAARPVSSPERLTFVSARPRLAGMMTGAGVTALMQSVVTTSAAPAAPQATLPGEPVSVPAARQFVRDALTGCPRADDLALAVTELASNAVRWSAARDHGTFTVTVRTAPRWARVEVTDPGPAAQPGGESNRWGLGIVAAITDRAGDSHGPGRSHTTWAEATWPAAATPDRTQHA
jgi:hypothetical protein